MQIGIGLPNPVPGTSGTLLLDWARRAEERGFAGLATIDRVAYPSHDSMSTLAAVAGATTRIQLFTNILIAPIYQPVLLAKAAATIDQVSAGRLTLGLAAGARPDDFAVAGRDFHTRGRDFDAALDTLHRAWRGEPIDGTDQPVCPTPVNDQRVPILVGGSSDAAIRRVAEWGAGWTMGGGDPAGAEQGVERVRSAWREAGREGEPRLAVLAYYSLGDDAEESSRAYLRDYYAFAGDYTDMIVDGALRSEDAVRGAIQAFGDAGITEIYLDPTSASLDQVDRLADVVL